MPEKPGEKDELKVLNKSFMVLVRPKDNSSNWQEISDRSTEEKGTDRIVLLPKPTEARVCEVGLDQESCYANERCQPAGNGHSRNGVCVCKDGYERDGGGDCVEGKESSERNATASPEQETTKATPTKIVVQVRLHILVL